MFKQGPVVLAVLLAGASVSVGCGLKSSGDDDDDSGNSSTGGAPVGFSGNTSVSTGGTTSSATGGSGPLGLGGSIATNTGGMLGTAGNGVFDGGSIPITPQQIEDINKQACAGFLTEGETLPSVLQLVVDVSSSMRDRAPGTANQSKWEVTRDALLEAIVGVNGPGLSPSIAVGLLFYPNTEYQVTTEPGDVNKCVNTSAMVPINIIGPQGAAQRTLIGNAISQAQLLLSTPTHDAYRYALNEGLLPSTAPGKKFMLLITDGTPTVSLQCLNAENRVTDVDPQPIVEEITLAAREEIKTFLIGSPGSEANRTWMSTAAVIGGTAISGCNVNGPSYCHMDMTTATDFSASLRAGLARVVGQITPCTFTLAEPPPGETLDQNKINIIVSSGDQSSLVVRDDVGDCSQGWQLTPDKEILLCPDTCSQVKSDSNAKVNVLFGCGSLMEPVIR